MSILTARCWIITFRLLILILSQNRDETYYKNCAKVFEATGELVHEISIAAGANIND